MASLSRPQSSAAVRSPPSGYPSSSLKYTNGSHYSHPQNQLHADPTAVFASESRKFLSSRKGERSYPSNVEIDRDSGRHRSGSYSASSSVSNGNGAASPETYHYHRGLPPPIPDRMHPSGRSQQQQLAAEMGRSATAVPRPHRTHGDEKGIYPSHMLPSSPTPIRSERSTMAPFSSYEDPYASHHHYRSPIHSPPPSSNVSTTSANSAGSPPPSLPQSPTRQVHNVAHVYGHGHGRHHSLSTNVYATDYASTNGAKLLPRQPTKRHTQQYTSSHHSGLGAVGPALAQNIPPVLPRPPSLKGSSSSSQHGLGRNGSLSRNGTVRKGDVKTITDEEQAAYAALNTYR